jgi:tellurite methyltransferase
MSKDERTYWDSHYRRQQGKVAYPAPDPILFEYVPPLFQDRVHRALDLGCGYGQNALWIAAQGYHTDAIDISRVALSAAQARATREGIRDINLLPLDLDNAQLQPRYYDVVVVFRFVKRGLMPALRATVRPGGRVIYQNPNTRFLNHDPNYDPEQLLRVGELIGYFADWTIRHRSNINGMSQLVADKPSA